VSATPAWSPTTYALTNALIEARSTTCAHFREVPMPLPSVANLREHHFAKAKRVKAHRAVGQLLAKGYTHKGSALIVLTRFAPRPIDSDNLASAFKAVRDGIADVIGVDDGHMSLIWHCQQAKATRPLIAVAIWQLSSGDPRSARLNAMASTP
jgi:crossover junction endodeoxyribonuclease RusA